MLFIGNRNWRENIITLLVVKRKGRVNYKMLLPGNRKQKWGGYMLKNTASRKQKAEGK